MSYYFCNFFLVLLFGVLFVEDAVGFVAKSKTSKTICTCHTVHTIIQSCIRVSTAVIPTTIRVVNDTYTLITIRTMIYIHISIITWDAIIYDNRPFDSFHIKRIKNSYRWYTITYIISHTRFVSCLIWVLMNCEILNLSVFILYLFFSHIFYFLYLFFIFLFT